MVFTVFRFSALISMLIGLLPFGGFLLPINQPKVTSPLAGEALQGVVVVQGSTDVPGYLSSEVAFSYDQDDASWFVLEQAREPVADGQLAVWDTTTITDGTYRLRVTVWLDTGETSETVVTGLRVRNYSPIETSTPVANDQAGAESLQSSPTPLPATPTPAPTFTPLPANPARITPSGLTFGWLSGASYAVIGFVLLGAYLAARNAIKKR